MPQETNRDRLIPMNDTNQKKEWAEEFSRSFSSKHGRNHHALAGDGKKSSNCEVCIEDKRLNPKGYYKTFLTEQMCYWNSAMEEDVIAYIQKLIHSRNESILDSLEKNKLVTVESTGSRYDSQLFLDAFNEGIDQAQEIIRNSEI